MPGARPSIFGDDPEADIDLSGFAPKRTTEKRAEPDATVRRTPEEGGFPAGRRGRRRYRAGGW
jgi:hypothetical protein